MLTNIKIENVAVIEKAEINFESGLNILTGETGAGKSIVIDSINAIIGERTSKELVRDGTDCAKITAFFENISKEAESTLKEFEIESEEDGTLLITRTINADGRSSCRINGQPVTASMLRSIGRELITICGQHDSQRLLQKENHIGYIDSLAGNEAQLNEYREVYHLLRKKERKLSDLRQNNTDKQQRLEFLQYQINELESADIIIGEKEQLVAQKKKIQNCEKILSSLYGAKICIGGDENTAGIESALYDLNNFLSQISDYNNDFSEFAQSAENFRYEIEECLSAVNDELMNIDEDETDINEVEQRLDLLYRLSKKYGETEEDMLSYLDKIREEYDNIQTSDERIKELEDEIEELKDEVAERAKIISKKRKEYALKFEKDVMAELNYLDMKGARFAVEFSVCDFGENGIDDVQFLISANAGQSPKPLSKIASGGELSRVMLAIRCVLSGIESAETIIFDEIDTGVSGRAAHKIAYKLKQFSAEKQIICVTHLAQIAAGADNHLLIEKTTADGVTATKVRKLIDDERIYEIARIIGGDVITKTTMLSACELIDFANTP
ncbi:MAG: DNA repair protein RecN [Acutalibacteraceae bacterium]